MTQMIHDAALVEIISAAMPELRRTSVNRMEIYPPLATQGVRCHATYEGFVVIVNGEHQSIVNKRAGMLPL